ncbi:hypothetical protein [Acidisphaera sp. L21]|uniref:hypothetical protein n=1 Tax=Acidisphaera sp. L21 TaxID=1641851 RepID=UPI00131C0428|nr:hypothetical protein [Acidisphaera sp. L21]
MNRIVPALVATMLVGACTAHVASAYPVPPALPAETMPLPPVSSETLVWQPGDWVFTGGSYRYDAGRYIPAAGHGPNWVFGHWIGTDGNYAWVPGGWN